MNGNNSLNRLHADLGFRHLNPVWAKLETALGLLGVGCGLILGSWLVTRAEIDLVLVAGALMLFVLGGYLTLAGHRSHLYQSNNILSAYLADLIRRSSDRDTISHEHPR
jgi:hypothetical protein